MTRRKLDSTLVLQIFQLRVQKKTIDQILEVMGDDVVSRGTVAKYVRVYDDMPGHLKLSDLPFEWCRLERAGLPWEASEWVMECQFVLERYHFEGWSEMSRKGTDTEASRLMSGFEPLTNRWADWCWRVHQADPNLKAGEVLTVAHCYSHAQQIHDLLPDEPEMDMRWLDAVLRYRPYASKEEASIYEATLEAGLLSVAPGLLDLITGVEVHLSELPSAPKGQFWGSMGYWDGLFLWLNTRIDEARASETVGQTKSVRED